MITVSRKLIHVLRAVLRRALKVPSRRLGPRVHFCATSEALRIRSMTDDGAVEHLVVGKFEPIGFSLPFEVLGQVQAKRDVPVVFDTSDGQLRITWTERSVPQQVEVPMGEPGLMDFPPLPADLSENSPEMIRIVHDASETTDETSSRYALGCLQLRGGRQGRVVGTDGGHLFMHTGFRFPWSGDVLVPGSKVFGSSELPLEPLRIGKTDNWVAFCIGPWTIHLPIKKDARFPNVDIAVPAQNCARAKVQVEEGDAAFLAGALPKLPLDPNDRYSPVTVDLNGQVTVRARHLGASTELVLANTPYAGEPARICMNRTYLVRALEMGIRDFWLFDQVVAGEKGARQYMWALLSESGIVAPSADSVQIVTPKSVGRMRRGKAA